MPSTAMTEAIDALTKVAVREHLDRLGYSSERVVADEFPSLGPAWVEQLEERYAGQITAAAEELDDDVDEPLPQDEEAAQIGEAADRELERRRDAGRA